MTLSEDAPVYRVSLLKSIKCSGCPSLIESRSEAVFFDHEHIGGYYHHEGEVEATIDWYLEGGRDYFEQFDEDVEEDPIVEEIRNSFRIHHNNP